MEPSPLQKMLLSSVVLLLLFLLKPLHALDIHNHHKYVFNNKFKALNRRFLVELNATTSPESFLATIPTEYQDLIKVHKSFTHELFRGLSIEILDQEHAVLRSMLGFPNIISISPNTIIERRRTIPRQVDQLQNTSGSPTLSRDWVQKLLPHSSSQVDKVHQELNLTGEGIFIGIIDDGIDYNLKALGGGFGPGFKVMAGYDLVGDAFNASDNNSVPKADSHPLDACNDTSRVGHGTHVAGIIAGYDPENGFVGVAPGAKLGMWRVFSCSSDTTSSELLIEAMLMAVDAGVHILSMSVGETNPWSDDREPKVKLLNAITAKGIHVITAAGNEGKDGALTVNVPSTAIGSVFSVASVVNNYRYINALIKLSGLSKPIGCVWTKRRMSNGELAVSFNGTDESVLEDDSCEKSSISSFIKGKIALVKRGGCTFDEKLANIKEAGGRGVIFYDNVLNDNNLKLIGSNEKEDLPSGMITYADGLTLRESFKKWGPTMLKFTYDLEDNFIPNESALTISSFSSIGPSADLVMKPDIAAVGDEVYSTLPSNLGGYGLMKGTSMACPYIAGSVALYLQYHGVNSYSSSTGVIYQKFKNYASQRNVNNVNSGVMDSTLRQGAGLVQVYDSITQVVHASPAQISFNDTSSQEYTLHNLTITNSGSDTVSYHLNNNVSIAIAPYNVSKSEYEFVAFGLNTEAAADIQFSVTEIHLKPGETSSVTVIVNPPLANPLDHIMYSGFIQFFPFDQIRNNASLVTYKPLHVPYFGIVGRQHDLPIFDPSVNITTLDVMHNKTYTVPTNMTFDLTADAKFYHNISMSPSFMQIEYRLVTTTTMLKAELLQWPQMEILGYIDGTQYFPQRSTSDYNTSIASWEGYYITKSDYDAYYNQKDKINDLLIPVSSGDYTIRLSALKIFGDQSKETDWETWLSGRITIIQR